MKKEGKAGEGREGKQRKGGQGREEKGRDWPAHLFERSAAYAHVEYRDSKHLVFWSP
jgi:hypothetical protein